MTVKERSVSPGLTFGSKRRHTYQNSSYDYSRVAAFVIAPGVKINQCVASAHDSAPVHPRDSPGQDNSTTKSLPPRVRPRALEDEEQGQGNGTCGRCNDNRANNVRRCIFQSVVADRRISEVVHAANGASRQDS